MAESASRNPGSQVMAESASIDLKSQVEIRIRTRVCFFRARTYLGNESSFLEGLCVFKAREFEAITGL